SVVQRGDGDAVHPLGDQLLDRLDLQRQLELLRVHLVDVDVVFLGGGLEALIARLVIRVDALGDHHEGLLRSGWGAVRHEEERRGTRERVLKAIRQLDYRPNPVAQALVTGRSRSLGVVSFDTTLYGPASTLLGIEEAAHDRGYAVSIASLRSLNRESVVSAVQRLRDQ